MDDSDGDLLLTGTNTHSHPADLRITDIRFAEITGAPMRCTLVKIYTNQDIVGFGEVRDFASKNYAAMLKSRIVGENPCDVDRLFRRIKQFGGHGRQGGGVSGIEVALWDLAGKAYGVPVYQLIGGKFRDRVRMYCDTDASGRGTAADMVEALKKRLDRGFTFLKMDLGISMLMDVDGALSAPVGLLGAGRIADHMADHTVGKDSRSGTDDEKSVQNRREAWSRLRSLAHPFTGIRITDSGLDYIESYIEEVRNGIGYDVPLAFDHFGHIGVEECIRLARRLERFSPAWLEDMIPWQMTDQYRRLAQSTTAPICTGEDIYLKEGFSPLIETGGIAVVHPDVLTAGGILESKKIADLATGKGIATAFHMAESPIGALAAVHTAAACEHVLAVEFHSADVDWWDDLVEGTSKPLVQDGYIKVPDTPGLGISDLNDEVIAAHVNPDRQEIWAPTTVWDGEWSMDRQWS